MEKNMKTGRPRKELDFQQFEKLCGIHCTLPELAAFFGVSEDTIERAVKRQYNESFAEVYAKKQGLGKVSLRRAMWQRALEGNVTLLIWLSKNVLGFSDKIEQAISGPNGGPIQGEFTDTILLKKRLDMNLKKLKMIE